MGVVETVVETLARAREEYERREWVAAFEALSSVDPAALDGGDFACLAASAYLTGHDNHAVQALQRAYLLQKSIPDPLAAVRTAFWLAQVLVEDGEAAVASGWVARAQRLLDDITHDVVELGYLAVPRMLIALGSGDFAAASARADEITAYGNRFGDPDLTAMGLSAQGRMAVYSGRVRAGLDLMDEAMICVADGEVSTIFAGHVYCTLIEGCQEVGDFGRAEQWTVALTGWCAHQPELVAFTGQCAVHRGQLMRLHGAYDSALEEFDHAVQRYLASETTAAAGCAWAERGEVLRLRGEYRAAEQAFTEATAYGHEPQPGLALLWLSRHRIAAAVDAAHRLLAEARDPVHRCRILPAAIEILLSDGAVDEAAELSAELTGIGADFAVTSLRAMAEYATGCVGLARLDGLDAASRFRTAARLWNELAAPYEAARCQVGVGRALRELGDDESAESELRAALGVFVRLGAGPARQEVERLLGAADRKGLTARELEVLRLVAAGHTNPEIAAKLVLSEKTVARHLSNIFTKLGVSSRTAAAAYAYEHDWT